MKIDLTVTVDEEVRKLLADATAAEQLPPFVKFGHLGTHFDVMNKTFSLDNTERRGILFDVSQVKDRKIEAGDIDMVQIKEHDFVMFYSGYLKEYKFGTPAYMKSKIELANALISDLITQKVSMIGIDFPGIRKPAEHPQADQYCADHDVFVIENLANLDVLLAEVKEKSFLVHTYPVNYEGLTGLPCRVIAEL